MNNIEVDNDLDVFDNFVAMQTDNDDDDFLLAFENTDEQDYAAARSDAASPTMQTGKDDDDFLLALENTDEQDYAAAARSDAASPAAVSIQSATAVLTGRLPLCMYLTCDDDHFTKFQVVLRKQIEFFETTSCPSILNPKKQGRNRPIMLGQVGLRCMHCRVSVMQEQATKGAVYYPSTLIGIYQAALNLGVHHFLADQCPNIPVSIKHEMLELSQSHEKKSSGGKQMWAKKAWALGVREDTIDGTLRFQRLEDRLETLQEMFQDDSVMTD